MLQGLVGYAHPVVVLLLPMSSPKFMDIRLYLGNSMLLYVPQSLTLSGLSLHSRITCRFSTCPDFSATLLSPPQRVGQPCWLAKAFSGIISAFQPLSALVPQDKWYVCTQEHRLQLMSSCTTSLLK